MILATLASITILLVTSGILLGKYLGNKNNSTSSEANNSESPIIAARPSINSGYINKQINGGLSSSQPQRFQTATAQMDFQEAYKKFNERIIQIENCMAIPGLATLPTHVTYKNGTQIMLDNRSQDSLEIHLGGKEYRLYGHEFALVTLSSNKLPATLHMDCQMGDDVGKNIAQITLQM